METLYNQTERKFHVKLNKDEAYYLISSTERSIMARMDVISTGVLVRGGMPVRVVYESKQEEPIRVKKFPGKSSVEKSQLIQFFVSSLCLEGVIEDEQRELIVEE